MLYNVINHNLPRTESMAIWAINWQKGKLAPTEAVNINCTHVPACDENVIGGTVTAHYFLVRSCMLKYKQGLINWIDCLQYIIYVIINSSACTCI